MADSKDDRGPADRARINIHEDYEIRYWSKKFGVTKEQLLAAVEKAGVSSAAVEKVLGP